MESSHNQTSAYITATHAYTPTHSDITVFENNGTNHESDLAALSFNWMMINRTILIIDSLIVLVAVLGICFTVYGLYSLAKTDHVAPVYVINLFVSDIIQTCIILMNISVDLLCWQGVHCYFMFKYVTSSIYITGVLINICFMVCISAERYIMIAHPLWYRNTNTGKTTVSVSVAVWIITIVIVIITQLYSYKGFMIFAILFLLLPYPLVMFFLVATLSALSRNMSVPHRDKKRIIATLALVLCIYTVLFLPYILKLLDILLYFIDFISFIYLVYCARILMALNPLFDFLLYLFMRRDAKDILRALFCCHKRHEENRTTDTVTVQV